MELETSALNNEISAIIQKGESGTAYFYKAYIFVKKTKKVLTVPKVMSVDIMRDYLNNFADKTIIQLAISPGVLTYQIQPYADDLEILLIRTPIWDIRGEQDMNRHATSEKFTATMVNNKDIVINVPKELLDEETLDLTDLIMVDFDLITKTAEALNMISCGGIFRNITTETAIRSVLTNEACQASNDDNIKVKGVDMIPATNLEVRDHIVVPHGIKIVDLPNYIQQKCGGVYNSGIGYFLQERFWYIYPAFDYTRINNTERTITFINIPKSKMPMLEQTFRFQGKHIIALAMGDITYIDPVDQNSRNEGNGISFTVASSVLHNMVTPGGNQAIIDRATSNTEVKTMDRPDGKSYVPVSTNPITDNAMNEFAKKAALQSGIITLTWVNSDPVSVLPGMMVRVYYMDRNVIKNVVGVVVGAQHYTYLYEKGFSSEIYVHDTSLTIMVDTQKTNTKE